MVLVIVDFFILILAGEREIGWNGHLFEGENYLIFFL